jgi:uncharacterized metal-binding protein
MSAPQPATATPVPYGCLRCPTRTHAEVAGDTSGYLDDERQALMKAADATPFKPDGTLRNRVEELAHFAHGRGMKRIGVAFCVSLLKEIGLPKAHPDRFAAICNPVAQARLLNDRNVDLVAQVGLCVGHDLVLQEECDAPVTTLVVKDRALDHHPVAALRSSPAAASSDSLTTHSQIGDAT